MLAWILDCNGVDYFSFGVAKSSDFMTTRCPEKQLPSWARPNFSG